MERETGIEPATSSLGSWHSTAELLPLSVLVCIANSCLVQQGCNKRLIFAFPEFHELYYNFSFFCLQEFMKDLLHCSYRRACSQQTDDLDLASTL